MKFLTVALAALSLCAPVLCCAQSPSVPGRPSGATPSNPAADQAWTGLVALTRPALPPVSTTPAPVAQMAALSRSRAVSQVQASRQIALAAKDFAARYPDHLQAPAARKLEALASVAGIADGEPAYEAAALKTAGDFRTNKINPISDRYEVAHAMERHLVGRKLGGKSWLSSPIEADAMADRLHVEFGHLPEVYANYLTVAERSNCDHSREVAARLLRLPAPPDVKARAQRVLDQANLLRKPLDFALTTSDGRSTRLSALAGKRTIVVFWAGDKAPAGPPGLQIVGKQPPTDTTWIYVSLGAWTPPVKGARSAVHSTAAPPGTYCIEALGLRSPLATQMKISSLPFVCVLDEKKNLNAFGRVDEIPRLLSGINRLIEP